MSDLRNTQMHVIHIFVVKLYYFGMELFPMQATQRSDSAATEVSWRTFRRSPHMTLQIFRPRISPYAYEHKS